jgi:hypothetical protein
MDTRSTSLHLPFTTLLRLEESAHDLSNTVGLAMNFLIFPAGNLTPEMTERVLTALECCTRAHVALKRLMWDLGEIRDQAQEHGITEERHDAR